MTSVFVGYNFRHCFGHILLGMSHENSQNILHISLSDILSRGLRINTTPATGTGIVLNYTKLIKGMTKYITGKYMGTG